MHFQNRGADDVAWFDFENGVRLMFIKLGFTLHFARRGDNYEVDRFESGFLEASWIKSGAAR